MFYNNIDDLLNELQNEKSLLGTLDLTAAKLYDRLQDSMFFGSELNCKAVYDLLDHLQNEKSTLSTRDFCVADLYDRLRASIGISADPNKNYFECENY